MMEIPVEIEWYCTSSDECVCGATPTRRIRLKCCSDFGGTVVRNYCERCSTEILDDCSKRGREFRLTAGPDYSLFTLFPASSK
jgi:hypothetical protein